MWDAKDRNSVGGRLATTFCPLTVHIGSWRSGIRENSSAALAIVDRPDPLLRTVSCVLPDPSSRYAPVALRHTARLFNPRSSKTTYCELRILYCVLSTAYSVLDPPTPL